MTARQWLGRARHIDREIDALMATHDETLARLTKVTQSYSADPVSGSRDPHKFDKLAELNETINAKIDMLVDVKREITEAIYQLDDGRQRAILLEYYIAGKTWEEVAANLHFSWRSLMYTRKRALARFEELCIELHIEM